MGTVYHNMKIGEQFYARFITTDDSFSPRECFHFMAFVMAMSAAYEKHVSGNGPFDRSLSIYKLAAMMEGNSSFIPSQEISIQSPGFASLKHRTKVVLVTSVLMAVAAATAIEILKDGERPERIAIQNTHSTSAVSRQCEIEVEESVNGLLSMISYDQWKESCNAILDTIRERYLHSSSVVIR